MYKHAAFIGYKWSLILSSVINEVYLCINMQLGKVY
jgi:hypothetical protein